MTLKEQAMLFHTPHLYACCSNWNAWANSFASVCMCKCVLRGFSHVLLSVIVSTRLLCPRDFPAKNTGVGCHAFLQGILTTQGSNLCLLLLANCSVSPSRWNGCLNCITVMSNLSPATTHDRCSRNICGMTCAIWSYSFLLKSVFCHPKADFKVWRQKGKLKYLWNSPHPVLNACLQEAWFMLLGNCAVRHTTNVLISRTLV